MPTNSSNSTACPSLSRRSTKIDLNEEDGDRLGIGNGRSARRTLAVIAYVPRGLGPSTPQPPSSSPFPYDSLASGLCCPSPLTTSRARSTTTDALTTF